MREWHSQNQSRHRIRRGEKTQYFIPFFAVGDNSNLEKRVKEVGRQVARFAYLHKSEHAQEFLRAWESAPMNPGGGKNEQQTVA